MCQVPYLTLRTQREVKSLSRVRLFVTPWTITYQAPLSVGFSRQEYWSGLLFPWEDPGDLPNPGIKPRSPAGRRFRALWSEPWGKPKNTMVNNKKKSQHIYITMETGMAIHSSILAWRIPGTEETGGLRRFLGSQRSEATERLTLYIITTCGFVLPHPMQISEAILTWAGVDKVFKEDCSQDPTHSDLNNTKKVLQWHSERRVITGRKSALSV